MIQGGWNDALADNNIAKRELFQFHHQPFAYYTKYAPFLTAPTQDYSASKPPQFNPATTGPNAYLQDEQDFFADRIDIEADRTQHLDPNRLEKPSLIFCHHDEICGVS